MLLPSFCRELNPSEHIELSLNAQILMQPLQTSAFTRINQHFHAFFVPFSCLWSQFPDFITGVNNPRSNLVTNGPCAQIPYIDGSVLSTAITDDLGITTPSGGVGLFNDWNDIHGYRGGDGAMRLLDLLGYGSYPSEFSGKHLNPFRLLAYQKIYYDFYRLQQYEAIYPKAFNIDSYGLDGSSSSITLDANAANIFTLRYRPWQKDIFTNLIPTPNFNSGIFNLPSNTPDAFHSGQVSGDVKRDSASSIIGLDANHSISISELRNAYALDQMLERTRRASGLDYNSQIKAHYGFDVKDNALNHGIQYLGGSECTLNINEVLATSNSDVQGAECVVGQRFGKGSGFATGHISFTAQEHGIVMVISSFSPVLEWNANFVNAFNKKFAREDYFQPEFDELGYQPIYLSDYFTNATGVTGDPLMGFIPRYSEYKTSPDLVHGQFRTETYDDFVGSSKTGTKDPISDLSAWCTPRRVFHDSGRSALANGASTSFLEINPHSLDSVMSVAYNGSQKTDQFLVNAYTGCQIVRPMSITGLPNNI
jgi:hypothetical protein